jgi:hypothetical protein
MRFSTWLGLSTAAIILVAGCGNSTNRTNPVPATVDAPASWEASFTLPAQNGGWSILTPSQDSRLIYVANSGNDATAQPYSISDSVIGTDPYIPFGAIKPYATITAALAQTRANFPDYVLLNRGDTWVVNASLFPKAGRSINERSVLGYYGSNVARPVVEQYGVDLSRANYSAVIGIKFVATQRIPGTPGFAGFNRTESVGLHALHWGNSDLVGGFLIEDCWFDWFGGNVLQSPQTTAPALSDIIVRRNIFTNSYSHEGHSQGLYSDRASILLEENIFDHNGWYMKQLGQINAADNGMATMFNHNTYFGATRNTIFRKNLFLRAASIGSKFTSNTPSGINETKTWNLQIDNNLYVEGEIGISLGGNDDQNNGPRWRNIYVTNNVMMHIGRTQPTKRTLGWGLDVQDWRGGLVQGNIFTAWGDGTVVNNTYALHSVGETTGVEYSNNIFYNLVGNNPMISFQNPGIQSNIKFFNNEIQVSAPLMFNDLTEKGFFHDNYYWSTLDQSRWFSATNVRLSLADYRTRTGDTTSTASTRTYAFPDRTLETYLANLGLATDMDSFVALLVQQSKFNWRTDLGAEAINAYIRGGFCITGSTGCP